MASEQDNIRPQFGNRTLSDPKNVFEHNAWDNVVWDEEQEREAKQKVAEQLVDAVGPDLQYQYENEAADFWDSFYGIHQNRFFKDRHWLFTEFPELSPQPESDGSGTNIGDGKSSASQISIKSIEGTDSQPDNKGEGGPDTCNFLMKAKEVLCDDKNFDSGGEIKVQDQMHRAEVQEHEHAYQEIVQCDTDMTVARFPGYEAKRRILEVGCGVGNTVFPILQTNNDSDLMVYCCDFSSTAVNLVRENVDYDQNRCHAFVCDIADENSAIPFPDGSLDIIILIFVLSAIHPDKMQSVMNRLGRFLKPGGTILFRDYGRYDMAQLRFKKGRCLSENFYVRGDGTRVYFFTQEELREMMVKAGLVEKQNLIDRRLQVNRGRQLKMYRVWIQCKYQKPLM